MASLTVGGVNIKVAVSSPRWTRMDAVDRARAFDNTFRASQTGGAVRTWDFETPAVLAATEGETYKAALSTIASQLCSGDIIALPTMCSAELASGTPVRVGGATYVTLQFSLHEIQPAKVFLRYSTGDTITGESFTRSTTAKYSAVPPAGVLASASIDVKRDLHHEASVRSLFLEDARTNYMFPSEDFSHASWAKTNITVTADNTVAPDGTTTADKVAATASAATVFSKDVAAPAATITRTIYIKKGSGATDANTFGIRNGTTATNLLFITINYDTLAISYAIGSSGASLTQQGNNGWYRLQMVVIAGITVGDTLTFYDGFSGGTETAGEHAFFWGAQLEPVWFASSYVPTTTAALARGADSYSMPFTLPPQELTAYIKFVERGTFEGTSGVFQIGSAASASPRLFALASGGLYYFQHQTSVGTVFSAQAVGPSHGSTVELLCRLFGDGSVDLTQSINGAGATVGAQSAALALASAWSDDILWLNSLGSTNTGYTALQAFKIVAGSRSLAEMRAL